MVHESLASAGVTRIVLGALLATIVVGCVIEEAPAGRAASAVRPAGCSKTLCDAARERCDDTKSASAYCKRCLDDCSGRSYDIAFDCMAICRDTVCASDVSGAGPCEHEESSCRRSDAERACIDGLVTASIPRTDASVPPWKPPLPAGQGSCSEAELDAFVTSACFSSASCREIGFQCRTCLARPHEKWNSYGAFADSVANVGGCVANVTGDASPEGCGAKIFEDDACLFTACPNFDGKCRELAAVSICRTVHDGAVECRSRLEHDPAYADCGLLDRSSAALRRLATHFCGKP